jgi:hypothetical protein
MEKQTAVSWLVERLAKNGTIHSSDIHKAIEITGCIDAEQYYNETFKSE